MKNHVIKNEHCRDPGLFRAHASSPDLNQGPSDLQSDALPTELSRQLIIFYFCSRYVCGRVFTNCYFNESFASFIHGEV